MSRTDNLLNFEAGKNTNIQKKYSTDNSNAFYAILAHSNRKWKYSEMKLMRVYSAVKMDHRNSQLGLFNEGI